MNTGMRFVTRFVMIVLLMLMIVGVALGGIVWSAILDILGGGR